MRLLLGILFCICSGTKADLKSDYKEHDVIPDIYDESAKIPDEYLTIKYGNEELIFGKHYTPTFLKDPPTIHPPKNVDLSAYYTLAYICPDWFSRESPIQRHFIMWIITNIPGNDFTKGDVIVDYCPAAPLKIAKAPPRYFFALYKQPQGKITVDIPYTANREVGIRNRWSIIDFAAKYNLGDPVAVNLFVTSYDDYSPIVHKEFMSYKKPA